MSHILLTFQLSAFNRQSVERPEGYILQDYMFKKLCSNENTVVCL